MIDEVYILDSDFQTLGVIDEFVSCIWTERYSKAGDFELVCPVNDNTTALLYRPADDLNDRYATIKNSNGYMVVEDVLLVTDAEDGDRYTVKGRSIESLLDRRVIWEHYQAENVTIAKVIATLITQNVTMPSDSDRALDLFRPNGESYFVSSSVNAEKKLKIAEYYGDNLYDVIVGLCESNHIGFRAVPLNGKFQLQIYDGEDRTYDQLLNPYVVFSEKFDNLLQSRWQKNTSRLKNYVLVRGDSDYDPVFLDGDALLKHTAEQNEQLYSGAYQETKEIEAEIEEIKKQIFDLTAQLGKLYNIPDSAENQRNRDGIESQITHLELYIASRQEALNNAQNNFELWQYYKDLQYKLGDPARQKMMLCSPEEPVTGLARRELWVDDSAELEKDEATVKLEEQNANYEAQIQQLWEEYFGEIDPATGAPATGRIDQVKAEVAELRGKINSNKRVIDQNNKQTLNRYYEHLSETGLLAMADHGITTSFDGQVDPTIQYRYGRDFYLGDLVQIRNEFGMEAVTRVTEVMRSRDEAGNNLIPTFVSD